MFGWFWSYLRRLNSHFDATVVTGAWLADRFARFGFERLNVVPLGIDRSTFTPDCRDGEMRRTMLAACARAGRIREFVPTRLDA